MDADRSGDVDICDVKVILRQIKYRKYTDTDLANMAKGGGYIAQHSHSVPRSQEAVDAMEAAILKYGRYGEHSGFSL